MSARERSSSEWEGRLQVVEGRYEVEFVKVGEEVRRLQLWEAELLGLQEALGRRQEHLHLVERNLADYLSPFDQSSANINLTPSAATPATPPTPASAPAPAPAQAPASTPALALALALALAHSSRNGHGASSLTAPQLLTPHKLNSSPSAAAFASSAARRNMLQQQPPQMQHMLSTPTPSQRSRVASPFSSASASRGFGGLGDSLGDGLGGGLGGGFSSSMRGLMDPASLARTRGSSYASMRAAAEAAVPPSPITSMMHRMMDPSPTRSLYSPTQADISLQLMDQHEASFLQDLDQSR